MVWMFTSVGCNKRTERIHERPLRLILTDYESFYDMLSNLNEKTIYQRCIKVLLTEGQISKWSLPELMNEVFHWRQNHYNLSTWNIFATDDPHNKFMLNSAVY